jgi:hypothetical protein
VDWSDGIDVVKPYVVRIITPQGGGTGWLVSRSQSTELVAVATASHVIEHAHFWEQPIRLHHVASGAAVILRSADRAIHADTERDTAGIVFSKGDVPFPADVLPLLDEGKLMRAGSAVGWVGFPGLAKSNLCFFSGHISAFVNDPDMYLVDGVAINGVSGGPAFRVDGNAAVEIIGVVSAYIPNRATGEVLPGVAVVRDVSQFHDLATRFKNFDQAKEAETPPDRSRRSTETAPQLPRSPSGVRLPDAGA